MIHTHLRSIFAWTDFDPRCPLVNDTQVGICSICQDPCPLGQTCCPTGCPGGSSCINLNDVVKPGSYRNSLSYVQTVTIISNIVCVKTLYSM